MKKRLYDTYGTYAIPFFVDLWSAYSNLSGEAERASRNLVYIYIYIKSFRDSPHSDRKGKAKAKKKQHKGKAKAKQR